MAASRFEVVSRNTKRIGDMEFTVVQDVKTGVLYTYGQFRQGLHQSGTIFTALLEQDGTPVVKPLNYMED